MWINKDSLAFVLSLTGIWKFSLSNSLIGNNQGGLFFFNPLSPYTSKVYLCHLCPLSFSPVGFCIYNSQTLDSCGRTSQTGEVYRYEDIHDVDVNHKEIIINGTKLIKFKTTRHAEIIYNLLGKLILTPIERRHHFINENIIKLLNHQNAQTTINDYEHQSAGLRTFTTIMFINLFFISPYLVWTLGLKQTIIPIAIFTYFLAILICVEFYHIHKYFYPSDNYDRICNISKMILCPPTAIGANDILTSNLVSFYDPLAIAFIFFNKKRFEKFAEKIIRDLKYPIKINQFNEFSQIINWWYRLILIKSYLNHFKNNLAIEKDFFLAPEAMDINCQSYCPRCLGQFIIYKGECPDCDGVVLKSFHGYER